MERVTVYQFKVRDLETDLEALAPRAATAGVIAQIMDSVLVEESARVVDTHCIDRQGFLIDGMALDAGQYEPAPLA